MFELFLSKTPNKEASPATARQARHTTEKYSFHFARARFFLLLMKRVFFCGVLPSKYSGRWRDWPQFDFAKEKRNSPQTPLPLFLCPNGTGTEAGGQKFLPPQPPSFLPACLGFAPKTFRRDGGTKKLNSFPKFQNALDLILSQYSTKS